MPIGVQCIFWYFQCEFETCRDWRYQRHAQWLPATPGFLPPASDIGEISAPHGMRKRTHLGTQHPPFSPNIGVCLCVFSSHSQNQYYHYINNINNINDISIFPLSRKCRSLGSQSSNNFASVQLSQASVGLVGLKN